MSEHPNPCGVPWRGKGFQKGHKRMGGMRLGQKTRTREDNANKFLARLIMAEAIEHWLRYME